MKYMLILLFSACIVLTNVHAQLKPFIGLTQEPAASDSICAIPNYLGSFENSGYQIGDTVNDFLLYDRSGTAFQLSNALASDKPVLLISSSYTCPIFRGKIPIINEVQKRFGDSLEVLVIYTVEAHPELDISPYFGKVNTGAANIKEGVLYRQPVLYGERVAVLTDLLKNIQLEVPVYIDGPCNEWWLHYGPAPNNATLIDPSGVVRIKHAWFDRSPDDILCDLESYFHPGSPCDSLPSGIGQFRFTMVSDTLVPGEPGSALYAIGTIENETSMPVTIEVRRLINNMPPDWSSSICLDVCYPTTADSTQITLKPKQKMDMIIDFFTGPIAARGSVRLGMRNIEDSQNRFFMRATAMTREVTSSEPEPESEPEVLVYPFPATSYLRIKTKAFNQYCLFDRNGAILRKGWIDESETIERKGLPAGMYFLKLSHDSGASQFRKVLFH